MLFAKKKKYLKRECDHNGECTPWNITYKFLDPNGKEFDQLPER